MGFTFSLKQIKSFEKSRARSKHSPFLRSARRMNKSLLPSSSLESEKQRAMDIMGPLAYTCLGGPIDVLLVKIGRTVEKLFNRVL